MLTVLVGANVTLLCLVREKHKQSMKTFKERSNIQSEKRRVFHCLAHSSSGVGYLIVAAWSAHHYLNYRLSYLKYKRGLMI